MIHIEKQHYELDDSEASMTEAFCGETAVLYPNGDTDPTDFDYVFPSAANKATCQPCKKAISGKTISKRESVSCSDSPMVRTDAFILWVKGLDQSSRRRVIDSVNSVFCAHCTETKSNCDCWDIRR